ncbi:MAG: OB-fold nucleic acid binding domain-containing protein, partial [Pirellulaceae bacterium]
MNDNESHQDEHHEDELHAARRAKLDRLIELGVDPWGQRFDDRTLIGVIRQRAGEVNYRLESGRELDLPLEIDGEGFDFRAWKAEQGKGELVGPDVRAAGRIILHRDKGKLHFIDIEDWTGRIQLFIGQAQVGEENWEIVKCLDLGDLIGVDGQLRRTNTGELS